MPGRLPPLALLLSLLAATVAAPLTAQDVPEIRDVRVGIDGHFKRGHWAEVRATVAAGGSPLQGELEVLSRDGDNVPTAFVCPQKVDLAAGESREFATLVKMGPLGSDLQLRVRLDKAVEAASTAVDLAADHSHGSTAQVIATLGPSAGADAAADMQRRYQSDEVLEVPLAGAKSLPETSEAYDAIDYLLIVASNENPLADATARQQDALVQWLEYGGRLIVVAGEGSDEMLRTSPWSDLLPGQVTGPATLKSDAGLRSFTGEQLSLEGQSVSMVAVEAAKSSVALWAGSGVAGERPLIVERAVGMGRVAFVLVDLVQPPLDQWPGRSRLIARIISGEATTDDLPGGTATGGRMTHLGYRDLSGQLRTALDQYEGVTPVHFYTVAGALVIYLLLLGPGEYFLLKRATPRSMHLTWLILPVLVGGFAAGAIWVGRSSWGGPVRVNEVELVDIDIAEGNQRGRMWLGMFSPEARAYDVTAVVKPGNGQVDRVRLAWQALPGNGLGGVDKNTLDAVFLEPFPTPYRMTTASNRAGVEAVPLAIATSKMLAGSWSGTMEPRPDASRLRRGKLRELEGSLTNVAPVALSGAYVAHGEWLYRAQDEIAPGASIAIDQLERRHLEYHFTQRRSALEGSDTATPWNQEEVDVPRILSILMFHRAVRGRSYTVLSHHYQPELDLSHLIRSGYAVLVGRSEQPLINLEIDGEPIENIRRWTYYRIIYPVAEQAAQDPS